MLFTAQWNVNMCWDFLHSSSAKRCAVNWFAVQCKAWGDLQGQALTLRRESYGSLQVAAVCRKQFGEQPQTIKIYLNPIPSAKPFSNQGFKRADLVTWHALPNMFPATSKIPFFCSSSSPAALSFSHFLQPPPTSSHLPCPPTSFFKPASWPPLLKGTFSFTRERMVSWWTSSTISWQLGASGTRRRCFKQEIHLHF